MNCQGNFIFLLFFSYYPFSLPHREVEKKVGGAGGNSKNKRGNSQPDLISFIKEEGKKEKKERFFLSIPSPCFASLFIFFSYRDIIHRNSARDRDGDRDKKRPAEVILSLAFSSFILDTYTDADMNTQIYLQMIYLLFLLSHRP